ncbi:MAG: hypothetical protein AAF944_11290 [Bacteroidota bacterium]
MKTRNTTYDLKQRVFRLGFQKLEEEDLFKKIREKMDRPTPKKEDGLYLSRVSTS